MNVFELAKKYYPLLWDKTRIDALYEAGKLTDEEYILLVGENNVDVAEEV